MIEIRNLTKKFDTVIAVNNLTIEFTQGIYGLVGQNGAGKSTLFRLIADVFDKDEGSISIDGFDSNTKEAKELIFFLSDDPYVERNSNIHGMIEFYSNFYDIDLDKFNRLIDQLKLPRNISIRSFSKGMRRQTFLALALSIRCKYLLLDEAFDGLDPLVLETIKEELLKLKDEGKVIVASSHNISTLEKLVDSFIMVTKGKLSGNDTSENIGKNFIKYQALFKVDVNENMLNSLGFKVVSFKKYGSICNIVLLEEDGLEDKIKSNFETILLERVPIDIEEIVMLKMMIAGKENSNENI